MGGRAFPYLSTPRMPPPTYLATRDRTTQILRTLFTHVVVPAEMPGKTSYGDVDFLVAGFRLLPTDAPLDWDVMVRSVRGALGTRYGRRGVKSEGVMFFAVRDEVTEREDGDEGGGEDREGEDDDNDSEDEDENKDERGIWIQIDVKVIEASSTTSFPWATFNLSHASAAKLLASLTKPLGLSILPSGLHIRVPDMEPVDWPGSQVFVTQRAEDVLKLLKLDDRFLHNGFATEEELYEWMVSTWVFHGAHFADRLRDEKFRVRVEGRAKAWVPFLTGWLPGRFEVGEEEMAGLEEWRREMRGRVKEEVFTMFPGAAEKFYTKRKAHFAVVGEEELRAKLMGAIPEWGEDWVVGIPRVFFEPGTTDTTVGLPTPPASPITSPFDDTPKIFPLHEGDPDDVDDDPPVYLPQPKKALPFEITTPRPPPANMSLEAKLNCFARWTAFRPQKGPYLLRAPREKGFEMKWLESGVREEVLVRWMGEVWGKVWVRQGVVNAVGRWKRKVEKEEKGEKGEKGDLTREKADLDEKMRERLERLRKLSELC